MRIFKTKWFAREASSHGISDDELYQAIQSALQGKVVDLGGGFIKSDSTRIAIAQSSLPKSAGYWFYTFLYAKQDMANINHRELMGFRELAKHYANLSEEKTTALVKSKELVEICDDSKK
ncbi:putative cytoplasmic protein (plasmid) [Klebsiella aerogenes]|nr:putative cytoplasmic protein [Klebsiella aerogenes]